MPAPRDDSGQASVELTALLPLMALIGLVLWQAALAGQAAWVTGGAARAAARAQAVGTDPGSAARSAVPRHLRRGLRVRATPDGRVHVAIPIPLLVSHLRLGTTSAWASFAPQR